MKAVIYSALILTLCLFSCKESPKEYLITLSDFPSTNVATRSIAVYLPPSYYTGEKRYPVLYMHDGQMLFDSTQTWNGQEWGVDKVLENLYKQQKIEEVIVVGIWNGGTELRHPEYFPQKPFESLNSLQKDSIMQIEQSPNMPLFNTDIQSDKYLKFVAKELKPYIDKNYRTKSDQSNTYLAGSSMVGLISWYGVLEYPKLFGGAISMSTHWTGAFTITNNPIPKAFFNYLKITLPEPGNHKFYFDHGTETLDALYEPFQKVVDSIFIEKGFGPSSFASHKFSGDAHDERSWNKRLHIPLTFLLEKK